MLDFLTRAPKKSGPDGRARFWVWYCRSRPAWDRNNICASLARITQLYETHTRRISILHCTGIMLNCECMMIDDMCSSAQVAVNCMGTAPHGLEFYLHDWTDENIFIKLFMYKNKVLQSSPIIRSADNRSADSRKSSVSVIALLTSQLCYKTSIFGCE